MKYIIHTTEEELQELVEIAVKKQIEPIKLALEALLEQRNNELLKIEDAMAILKVSRKTINNWMAAKKLRCRWLGSQLYFTLADIMNSLETNF